jgi:predicted DsbA family dithiol-disulfide isomerase
MIRGSSFGTLNHVKGDTINSKRPIAADANTLQRTPNTFNAHRLIWLAKKEGVQDAVVEGLFSAYFVEGRDVGDKAILAEVAAASGIDK